ncbi:MAG: hypothetical protein AAGI44_06245 [Pseudomonadota bacterium]
MSNLIIRLTLVMAATDSYSASAYYECEKTARGTSLTGFYAKLTRESLLQLTGPDASTFLQGQVTCDVRNLSASSGMPGVYCSVQGRVICDFLLCQLEPDHLLLRMRRDILPASLEALSKYSVFSKVKLHSDPEDFTVLGCWGEGCAQILRDIIGTLPEKPFETVAEEGFVIVRTPTAGDVFECYLDIRANSVTSELQRRFTPASESEWHVQQVQNGVARIEASTSGEFVPQVLNYDLSSHISFTKGCYTGQEVVARLHYRGKPKRRLYYAELTDQLSMDDSLIEVGTPLFSAGSSRAVGNLINTAEASSGRHCMLITATEQGAAEGLHLNTQQGQKLTLASPPLAVELQ